MKLGNVTLSHGLFLGPMAGYTDYAMRRVAREAGAEYLTTEMVSAKAITYADRKTAPIARVGVEELPCAVQLFGHEPDVLAEAARKVASGAYGAVPTAIDLNMGCPVHKIVSGGDGSALMRDPALAATLVGAVKRAVSLPVTVKMRIGWDPAHVNASEFAKAVEAAGADMICVHGRTRTQGYSGTADLSWIAAVKAAVSVPVVGNGDIRDVPSALRMYRETGCDGIMIGRGAVGNPFLFGQIVCALEGRPYTKPTPEQIWQTAMRQLSLAIADKGEATAVLESRKQIGEYLNGYRCAAVARREINSATSPDALSEILRRVLFEDTEDFH